MTTWTLLHFDADPVFCEETEIRDDAGMFVCRIGNCPSSETLAEYHELGMPPEPDEAAEFARNLSNARLIAAAPDLLDALLDALPYVEDVLSDPAALACFKPGTVQRHAKAIRAAIARATGGAV